MASQVSQTAPSLSRTASRRQLSSISAPMPLPSNPALVTPAPTEDVFSLSDEVLSESFCFVKEIGFGNWGSVWLCKRKLMTAGQKVAIKLVHRSKTPTTAARVRSLWNEFKVLKTLTSDHPSIIAFESFVVTPSYALIVMPFMEHLIPVNIPETEAKPYFSALISGVAFLHSEGITHNDIKPSNILMRFYNVPVLVDFGFATKWEDTRKEPFFSTISWGTPEYLSAARARGVKHDERTSDVWSLGITLFEIVMGRTPFEESEQEQFATPDELDKYYQRTVAGTWIGSWNFSVGVEDLLQRMMNPDDRLRITAANALNHSSLRAQVLLPPVDNARYLAHTDLPWDEPQSPAEGLSFPIYRDLSATDLPDARKQSTSPKKARHIGLTSKPSRETIRTAAKPVKVRNPAAFSPSKKRLPPSPRRRVISKNAISSRVASSTLHARSESTSQGSDAGASGPDLRSLSSEVTTDTPADSPSTVEERALPPLPLVEVDPSALAAVSITPATPPRASRLGASITVSPTTASSRSPMKSQARDSVLKKRPSRVLVDFGDRVNMESTRSSSSKRATFNGSPAKPSRRALEMDTKENEGPTDNTPKRRPTTFSGVQSTLDNQGPAAGERSVPPSQVPTRANVDRITSWVRGVERKAEEARAEEVRLQAPVGDPIKAHVPRVVSSSLSVRGNQATPTRAQASELLAVNAATPTRTIVNGVAVSLPNGRPLADVPESVGFPSPMRALSTPAEEVASPQQQPTVERQPRIYETIAFSGHSPVKELKKQDSVRSNRLKKSRSKLMALFQAEKDGPVETERLSFLKFPPPPAPASPPASSHYIMSSKVQTADAAPLQAPAPPKRTPSLVRLKKSLKNLRPTKSAHHLEQPPPVPALPTKIPVRVRSPDVGNAESYLDTIPGVQRRGAGWASPPISPEAEPYSPDYSEFGRQASLSGRGFRSVFSPSSNEIGIATPMSPSFTDTSHPSGRRTPGGMERDLAGTPATFASQWTDETTVPGSRSNSRLGKFFGSMSFRSKKRAPLTLPEEPVPAL